MSDQPGRFSSENAREMAARSHEARVRNRTEAKQDQQALAEVVKLKIADLPPRAQLASNAQAVLFMVAEKLLAEEIPVRTAKEAATVSESMFNILRLETGQATSIMEHATREEKLATISQLRTAAEKRTSGSAPQSD